MSLDCILYHATLAFPVWGLNELILFYSTYNVVQDGRISHPLSVLRVAKQKPPSCLPESVFPEASSPRKTTNFFLCGGKKKKLASSRFPLSQCELEQLAKLPLGYFQLKQKHILRGRHAVVSYADVKLSPTATVPN